jgi:phosphatidylinositol alpha-mannosyltransferase
LYVGRLDKRKGLKYLFRAVAAAQKRIPRRLRLIVVGDNGLRRHLLPRLPRRVELCFTGVVSAETLPRYFASADVFCSPATGRESFGIVLIEAMASGTPVIATSIPGYLTILRHRLNSLVVAPRDSRSLGAAIAELASDDELRVRIRENALRFVSAYGWDHVVGRLETVYAGGGHPDIRSETARRQAVIRNPVQVQKA